MAPRGRGDVTTQDAWKDGPLGSFGMMEVDFPNLFMIPGRNGPSPSIETRVEWIADMTLFPKVESRIFGANIPEKKNAWMCYMAGLGNYRNAIRAEKDEGQYADLRPRPGHRPTSPPDEDCPIPARAGSLAGVFRADRRRRTAGGGRV